MLKEFGEVLINRPYRLCGVSLLLIVLFLLVPKKIAIKIGQELDMRKEDTGVLYHRNRKPVEQDCE